MPDTAFEPLRPGLLTIIRSCYRGVSIRLEGYTNGWEAWVDDHCFFSDNQAVAAAAARVFVESR